MVLLTAALLLVYLIFLFVWVFGFNMKGELTALSQITIDVPNQLQIASVIGKCSSDHYDIFLKIYFGLIAIVVVYGARVAFSLFKLKETVTFRNAEDFQEIAYALSNICVLGGGCFAIALSSQDNVSIFNPVATYGTFIDGIFVCLFLYATKVYRVWKTPEDLRSSHYTTSQNNTNHTGDNKTGTATTVSGTNRDLRLVEASVASVNDVDEAEAVLEAQKVEIMKLTADVADLKKQLEKKKLKSTKSMGQVMQKRSPSGKLQSSDGDGSKIFYGAQEPAQDEKEI